MASETYKEFTLNYATLRNEGLENKSNIDIWEYDWANLSGQDGFSPDEFDFKPLSRLDKQLTIKNYPKND